MTMDDRDILISRVVDQEATGADWAALHELAESDPTIWRELAQAQRDQADLGAAVERAVACADAVEIPSHEHYSASLTERVRVVTTWSGWVAAAVLALMWTGVIGPGVSAPSGGSDAGNNRASLVPVGAEDPEAALDLYLKEGRRQGTVIGEIPQKVLVDVVTGEAGEVLQVIYLRQILETKDVDAFNMLANDELGRPDPSVRHQVVVRQDAPAQPD